MVRSLCLVAVMSLAATALAQPGSKDSTTRDRITELKERVELSKARLKSLADSAFGDGFGSTRVQINHRNELGAGFELESLTYALDGAPLLTSFDSSSALDQRTPISLLDARLLPGHHLLVGRLVYRGTGFGHVFKYLEGYRFKLETSCVFDAVAGKPMTVDMIGFDRGGADFAHRPGFKCSIVSDH